MHVYLNPNDLLLMARRLGFPNTGRLFDEKLVIIDYGKNGAPVPRLRFSRGPSGCCPFLENRLDEEGAGYRLRGLCTLHPDDKPLVCWLAPGYRVVDIDAATEEWGFRPPLPGCPGCARMAPASPGPARPQEFLSERLDSEKNFFAKLSFMLDNGYSEVRIVKSLYFLSTEEEDKGVGK